MRNITLLLAALLLFSGAYAEEACYSDIDIIQDDLVWVETDCGEGLGDLTGNLLTPAQWERVRYLGEGMACGEREDGIYLLDLAGGTERRMDVDDCYDIRRFAEGLALIRIDGLWGYIDRSGSIVIEPEYDMDDDLLSGTSVQDTHSFTAGVACVSRDGKYGAIDKNGAIIVPFDYSYARACECGLIRATDADTRSLFDSEGNLIFETVYNFRHANDFSPECDHENDLMSYTADGGLYGFIDMRGNMVSEAQWDYANDFSEGYARVKKGEKYNFIDTEGRLLYDTWYEWLVAFENGVTYARIDGREGILDAAGNWVLEPVYDNIMVYMEPFMYEDESGYRTLEKDGLYGVLSPEHTPVTDTEFADVGAYGDDRINVCKNGRWGYIDGSGEIVIGLIYDEARRFSGGWAIVAKDGKYGVIDTDGNAVIPFIYENILAYSDGCAVVMTDGKWGMADVSGEIIVEPVFYEAYTREDSAGNVYYLFIDLDTESLYDAAGKLVY